MSYVASENIRRFRALLETALPPERRKTIEALLAAELVELEKELGEAPSATPDAGEAGPLTRDR